MVRTCRKFPNEWEKYESIGQVIDKTRIFAFKTPLKLNLQTKIPKTQRFVSLDLYRRLAETGRTLGLVINLNNTDRYYDKADIEGMLIAYKEIPCPGRGFLSRNEFVKIFYKTVEEFIAENQDNDHLIGVHCTNGVNRSGYLICRYLIDRLGWSSHEALNAFEVARGYPIERGSFVQSLHKADRENRLKGRHLSEELDVGELKADRKKKKKRRDIGMNEEISGLDPALTAQMMQQLFQMEQQFKHVAKTALSISGYIASPYDNFQSSQTYESSSTTQAPANSNATGLQQKIFTQFMSESSYSQEISVSASNDDEEVEEEENEESKNRVIDYESMGKVDVREISASEGRRARRKRLVNQFKVMKRGRFWEINEMRKNMGL